MTPGEKVGLTALGVGILGLLALGSSPTAAVKKTSAPGSGPAPGPGPGPGPGPVKPTVITACSLQDPQDFLIRGNYRNALGGLEKSIAWRTEQYGYVQGFGDPSLNPSTPSQNSAMTTFFGIPVKMNKKVIASLACVEDEIKKTCGTAYQPQDLSGLRTKNTYVGGEVSNHMYGIAIDVDPLLNPCCGCLGKWALDPKCQKTVTSEFDRMAMPKCWVDVFERHGWYWLGHDTLRDTMHFEFLGVPPELKIGFLLRR